MTSLICGLSLIVFSATAESHITAHVQSKPDRLVRELGDLPAALPGGFAPKNGVADPVEERRARLYGELRDLGDGALPALIRGLADADVHVRRNVALFLGAAAGGWFDRSRRKINIHSALPALTVALDDADDRVRELAAQAVGVIGPSAASAVPALIRLLSNSSEGSRNTACIGLRGIGPAAGSALPALRKALSDRSPTTRRFAQRAIDAIDVR